MILTLPFHLCCGIQLALGVRRASQILNQVEKSDAGPAPEGTLLEPWGLKLECCTAADPLFAVSYTHLTLPTKA